MRRVPDHRARRHARSAVRSVLGALLLSLLFGTSAPWAFEPGPRNDLVGENRLYVVGPERTLLEVAREVGLGVLEVMAANYGIDPWLPGEGTAVLLPTSHILPEAPREGIVVNLAELRIYYFPPEGGPVFTTALGVGRAGFMTPLGETKVVRKAEDPTWYPTAGARARDPQLPSAVPPGPANPLGDRALYLGWSEYLIHGTNKPYGVGRRVSSGCMRLYPEAITALYERAEVGTRVTVVDQPVKLGWRGGELYLEVHPDREQLDKLEATRGFPPRPAPEPRERILAAVGSEAERLDWPIIRAALQQRTGVPVRITRDLEAPRVPAPRIQPGQAAR